MIRVINIISELIGGQMNRVVIFIWFVLWADLVD